VVSKEPILIFYLWRPEVVKGKKEQAHEEKESRKKKNLL